jgi:DNA polymerase-4
VGRSGDLPRGQLPASGQPGADDTGCTILHVDMDAFYASVEIREQPRLAGRPVVVAGGGSRGVVLSASYEARAYGVRSAMPAGRARVLCPGAVFVEPTFARYTAVSKAIMAVFRAVTPLVEPLSLDEAFLDVAGALRRTGRSPAQLGSRIRAEIAAGQGVTCSVGVAPNKFLAKLSSGLAKPDGLLVVPVDGVLEMLHPLPVAALWGVGKRTAELLGSHGLRTVGEVAATPLPRLRRLVGQAAAAQLHTLANGRDARRVQPDIAEKSVGAEETFARDLVERAVLHRELLALAQRVAATLRGRGLRGRTISIKVRYADFSTVTRARTLPAATDVAAEVYATACELMEQHVPDRSLIRLLGVRVEQLRAGGLGQEQPTLDAPEHGWRDAEVAADGARAKYGWAAVRPAALLSGGGAGAEPDERRRPGGDRRPGR